MPSGPAFTNVEISSNKKRFELWAFPFRSILLLQKGKSDETSKHNNSFPLPFLPTAAASLQVTVFPFRKRCPALLLPKIRIAASFSPFTAFAVQSEVGSASAISSEKDFSRRIGARAHHAHTHTHKDTRYGFCVFTTCFSLPRGGRL